MNPLISIQIEQIKKKLGPNQALNGLSLEFEAGKMHGIIGPEGAGKTTLMRTLLGLLKPDSGRITYRSDNQIVPLEMIRPKIAYMPQQQSLYPDLSIDEHLHFFKALYQISSEEFENKRKELLEITRLSAFVDRAAGQLSGGMYKKLGLMCALLRSPEAILLDEPTNGVDPISRREFWELLYHLMDRKILILVATAYMDEAERCSKVDLLDSGKCIGYGEPRELLTQKKARTFDEIFLQMNGQSAPEAFSPSATSSPQNTELAVSVANLSVQFGDFYAVKDISFSVSRGEIFGFLGANGAGKTTTIRVLCGLLRPTTGTAVVAGVGFEHGEMAIKAKVGYMSQKFTLYDDLTVEENLSFIASLRKLDQQTFLKRRNSILEFIAFQRPLHSFVKDLPGGIKQQVSLAASLLHNPEIVFLDEPTAGVTPAARARFWALIRDLSSQGKTIFVTTHYMDEAEQCDRIALMKTGEIIALNTPNQLKAQIFPNQIFELTPKKQTEYSKIAHIKLDPNIDFFEPYGLRFHATFKTPTKAKDLEADFVIRQISPTLEDVFIKTVEGSKREGET